MRPKIAGTGTPDAGTARSGNAHAAANPSERVRQDVDLPAAAAVGTNRGDVEAQRRAGSDVIAEPPAGQPPEPLLLTDGDGFGGRAEGVAPPRLHLAERDRSRSAHDKVELAFADAPVAVEHLVARGLVPRRGGVFSRPAYDATGVAQIQRSLPGSSSTFTSLKVTTRTSATNRVLRYMSHTHASRRRSSKYVRPSSRRTSRSTSFAR